MLKRIKMKGLIKGGAVRRHPKVRRAGVGYNRSKDYMDDKRVDSPIAYALTALFNSFYFLCILCKSKRKRYPYGDNMV